MGKYHSGARLMERNVLLNTHQRAHVHNAYMDDWASFTFTFTFSCERQKRSRWHAVLSAVGLNYYIKLCQVANSKINLRLNYNREFFFLRAECVNFIVTYFSHFPAFYLQHLQGLKWIFENNSACGFWEFGETCRGTESFWIEPKRQVLLTITRDRKR